MDFDVSKVVPKLSRTKKLIKFIIIPLFYYFCLVSKQLSDKRMMKSFCSIITVTCILINISFVNSVENMSAILSHAVVPDVIDISPTEAVHVGILDAFDKFVFRVNISNFV